MDTRNERVKVPRRILNTLLTSLGAGVVPRTGAPYIAIGRAAEVRALTDSLDMAAEGGASVRFLIGRYGSGKSFLTQLIRGYALERDFLTVDADLSPERRLSGAGHSGLATYRELMRNLSSKASPDGGALPLVLGRYMDRLKGELAAEGVFPDDVRYTLRLRQKVYAACAALEGAVGGFDFATVLGAYFASSAEDDEAKKSACLRYLRGEYSNKTEARQALGFSIGAIIDDQNWYDMLKLIALLSVQLGYRGLCVFIDECVNLYKIPHRISREANYEKILSIFNDALQGRASHLAVVFCGTPQFLEDPRRGLFGYEALRSRLADTRFEENGYVNYSSPVIRLRRLSDNELMALLVRLSFLHAEQSGRGELVTKEEMERFLSLMLSRAGAGELITPRELIREFLGLLNILRDNEGVSFDALIEKKVSEAIAPPVSSEVSPAEEENGGTKRSFTLADIDL